MLEDLHWADEALLAFVDYVAVHAADLPLLLVATARPAVFEQHPAFAASGGRVTRIWLDRLTDDETRALVTSLPEMEGRGAHTVDLVARRADGNPFFAEELAKLLAESGGDADLAALPQSVQAVIAARIDTLSPAAKGTLADAAVIGVVFWRGALRGARRRGPGLVDEGLLELESRQLVRAVRQPLLEDEEEFAFAHWMVREVAYGEVPRGVRALKHAAFARWLRDKVGERGRGDLSDVLAGHFAAAAELAQRRGRRRTRRVGRPDRPSSTSASPATGRSASTCAPPRGTTGARSTWRGRSTRRGRRCSRAPRKLCSRKAATATPRPRCSSRRSACPRPGTGARRLSRPRAGRTCSTRWATRA